MTERSLDCIFLSSKEINQAKTCITAGTESWEATKCTLSEIHWPRRRLGRPLHDPSRSPRSPARAKNEAMLKMALRQEGFNNAEKCVDKNNRTQTTTPSNERVYISWREGHACTAGRSW